MAPEHRLESQQVLDSKLAPLRRALLRMGPRRSRALLEGLDILVEEVTSSGATTITDPTSLTTTLHASEDILDDDDPAHFGGTPVIDILFGKLGRGVVRFRWVILIIWVLGIGFASHAFPTLASQVNNNNSEFLPASTPSNQAADLAKPLIGSITQAKVTVVAVTSDGTLDSADQSALTALAGDLHRVPTVKSVTRKATSPNQKAQLLQVVSTVSPFDQAGTKKLVDNLESTLQKADLPSGLQANLAGSVATNVANQEQSNKQSNEIQFASIIFILILLVVIFRALLAPVVTLLGPVFALSLSTRFIGALGEHGLKISFFTQILLIVLLLGAGTDYGFVPRLPCP